MTRTNFRTKCELYICSGQRKFLIGIIMLKLLTSIILHSFRNRNYLKIVWNYLTLFRSLSFVQPYPGLRKLGPTVYLISFDSNYNMSAMHFRCYQVQKVSKYVIYTQHHLRLLCYLHLSGISENQAGDNTLKINRESPQFNLFGEILEIQRYLSNSKAYDRIHFKEFTRTRLSSSTYHESWRPCIKRAQRR